LKFPKIPRIIRIPLLFGVFSILWIVFSDTLTQRFAGNLESATEIAIIKGSIYVIVSSFLIYFLLKVDEKSQASLKSELKAVNDSFSTLYQSNPQPMLIYDPEGSQIIAANDAVLQMYEYSRDEFLKCFLHDLIVPEEYTLLKMTLENNKDNLNKTGPWRTVTKSGKILYAYLMNVNINYSGKIVSLTSVIDISEQVDIEAALKKTALERDDFEAFGFSLSHDLRASLRAITGYGQILSEDYKTSLDAKGLDYLEKMTQASQSMNRMIDNLLMLSGITHRNLRIELIDLGKIAREIADQLKKQDPERQAIFTLLPGVFARCDRDLIQIVLYDLLENAWKYTSKNLTTEIEFGLKVNPEGKRIFFVRDNGVGFDPEKSGEMFKPFQRFHSASDFKGNGVGLSVVSRIISRHKGKIWAEGQVGQGAAFFFTLGLDDEPLTD
jgi:PAS domain S-box-containing protein